MAKFVRDSAGKKASVRSSAGEGAELVDTDAQWDWYVDPRTGRYFVVASSRSPQEYEQINGEWT